MNSSEKPKNILTLCEEVLAQNPENRTRFLEERCGDDTELRRAVDSVLVAVSESNGFLTEATNSNQQSLIGQRVGDYEIIEQIAEGGMGAVFLAHRKNNEFDQNVAIKFVHRQFLAKETVRRFDAERQILAALQHPYIAQLIDGGTTADGIPYLVMEFVDGKPIDQYCDDNRLTIRERLELVQKIALAVQAAHRNLVVHRDLKPSNVLVTADGIPKLLDFGIAKLIDPASDHTGNTTLFGRQAMTPDFASPEQVLEGTVTTASDVYSLGILTYQLLTGSRPYGIGSSNFRDIVRFFETHTIIPPGRFVSSLENDAVVRVAEQRRATREKLLRNLGGDIEQIVTKALQTDTARRYQSVSAFSDDIENFLGGMPVNARGDSTAYRLSRFVSRNRVGVGAAAITLLAIVSGLGAALWQANAARQQLQRAEAVSGYLSDILLSPSANWDASIQTGADATITDVLGAAEVQLDSDLIAHPEVRVELYNKIAEALSRMGNHDDAIRVQEKSINIAEDALAPTSMLFATTQYRRAETYSNGGHREVAVSYFEEALETINQISSGPSIVKLYILNDAAFLHKEIGNTRRALEMQQQAVNDSHELLGDDLLPLHTNGYSNLAIYQFELGMLDEAEKSLTLGLTAHRIYPENTSHVGGVMHMTTGRLSYAELDHAQAAQDYQQSVDLLTLAFNANHGEVALASAHLARAHARLGNIDQAAEILDGFDRFADHLFEESEAWAYYLANATVALARGDATTAIEQSKIALRPESLDVMWEIDKIEAYLLQGNAFFAAGDTENARKALALARQTAEDWVGVDHAFYRYVTSELLNVR